ncbi:hypothetical protein DMN91_003693 [Ooceraea biroi]|uniref:Double jelly roll-like domain-containing protein n=1 Tax=Ooceraea biroi TaxID=2015173 RepID=A0A3L8DUR8_OOCBI|nr:hypothetical protein DMN91_003693 [Ooceraea biroi]
MENVRNRVDVKLVTRWDGRHGTEALIARPNFHSRAVFGENLLAVELRRLKATFNRPIYVGMCILNISKTRLYEFHYEYITPLYGDKCRIMYTGTDSLIYSIDGPSVSSSVSLLASVGMTSATDRSSVLIGTGVSGAASCAGVELISGDDAPISLCRPIFSFRGVTIADDEVSASSSLSFLFARDVFATSGSSTALSTNRFNGSTIGLKWLSKTRSSSILPQDLYTLLCESYLYIEGTFSIVGTAAGEGDGGAAHTDQARLVNNCAAFLFDEIRYELNGVEIDRSRNVGVTSTLKSYASLTHAHANILQNAGWNLANNTLGPGNFNLCVPLGTLLGFCEDYRCVVINARHELVLIRARNDNNCVVLSSDRHEPKIDLHKVQWRMPHVYLNEINKLRLLRTLESGQFLSMAFHSWNLYKFPLLQSTTAHTWAVKAATQLEKPRYVIFALQTGRRNVTTKDASLFDELSGGGAAQYAGLGGVLLNSQTSAEMLLKTQA